MKKSLKKKYEFAVIAADVAVFTIEEGELKVLLIKMKKKPFENHWALPGGLVEGDESVDHAAMRHLKGKTGVNDLYLEQLYTFGRVDRDPFGRVVSVSYFSLVDRARLNIKTSEDYDGIRWFPVNALPALAYDHKEIIACAKKRLQSKLEYTNVVYSLLPIEFTLYDMQSAYETILGRKLDKRNFRKKIHSLNIIRKTGKKTLGEKHRPAEIYKFIKRKPKIVEIL